MLLFISHVCSVFTMSKLWPCFVPSQGKQEKEKETNLNALHEIVLINYASHSLKLS